MNRYTQCCADNLRGQHKSCEICCRRTSKLIPYFKHSHQDTEWRRRKWSPKLVWHSQPKYVKVSRHHSFSLRGVDVVQTMPWFVCIYAFILQCNPTHCSLLSFLNMVYHSLSFSIPFSLFIVMFLLYKKKKIPNVLRCPHERKCHVRWGTSCSVRFWIKHILIFLFLHCLVIVRGKYNFWLNQNTLVECFKA